MQASPMYHCLLRAAFLSLFSLAASFAHAEIHLAQVVPMTGPIGVEGREYNVGISVAIAAVNSRGGVAGQRLVLHTDDDEYQADKTVALMRKHGAGQTMALLLPIGSASMQRVIQEKVLDEAGIPVVGMVPGAEPFRSHRYIYHVRAGDLDQYRTLVRTAMSMNMKKVAVVYADIPFGRSGLATVESLLAEESLKPVATVPVAVKSNADYSATIEALEKAAPNIIMMMIPAQIAGEFLAAFRASGSRTPISTPSYGNHDTLCAVATIQHARGVGVAQVFPNVRNDTLPVVRRFHQDFKAYAPKDLKPTMLHLEGYVTANVVIEALRRIEGQPTRAKLTAALNAMKKVDLGGFEIDYSATKRTGSSFVDVGVISSNCYLLY